MIDNIRYINQYWQRILVFSYFLNQVHWPQAGAHLVSRNYSFPRSVHICLCICVGVSTPKATNN